MSVELLRQMDKDFGRAVEGKIPCIVLSRGVRDLPGALQEIQTSENAGHILNTLESLLGNLVFLTDLR